MTDALVLDRDVLKQVHRRVRLLYRTLMERDDRPIRLFGVFEAILHAYPGMDADALVARIESLVADHGPEVRRVIESRLPGAADYVLSRDWLYDGPDALVIADLARNFPSRLRAMAATADFYAELEAMASELNGK